MPSLVPPAPHRHRTAIEWLTRRIRGPRAEPPQSALFKNLYFLLAGDQALSEVWFGLSCDRFFELFGKPQLDHRLAGHAQPMRLAV